MKRWVAALVAALFLATATVHVLAHHADFDDGCKVCQVQLSSAPAVAPPRIVVLRTVSQIAARVFVRPALAARPADVPARAPPALPS